MRISELSRTSGISVATIKYYLREGLLPNGTQTAPNQATYDDSHIRRLRLIRALIEIGGLSVARVREALAATEDESTPIHDAFGAVMHGLDDPTAGSEPIEALDEVHEWLSERGWVIEPDAPAPRRLAELITVLREFGFPLSANSFDAAADHAAEAAEAEVRYARSRPDRIAAVETMLVGTVVLERALAEVRRLALEAASAQIDTDDAGPTRDRSRD